MTIDDEVTQLMAEGQSKFQQAVRTLRDEAERLAWIGDSNGWVGCEILREQIHQLERRARAIEALLTLSDMELFERTAS